MRKITILLLSLILSVGVTVTIQAGEKKNLPKSDPLATITPGSCSNVQIAPFGTSLLASWEWDTLEADVTEAEGDSGGQTKFGGDAVYEISASLGNENFEVFEVGFGLVQYEPGTPADSYPGEMVYRCSNAQTDPSGACNGSVLGLRNAIMAAAAAHLGVLQNEITDITAELMGVYVKPMNPGNKKGHQNYDLTNVCPEEDIF